MDFRVWPATLMALLACVSCVHADQASTVSPTAAPSPIATTQLRQIIVISDLHMGEGRTAENGAWRRMEDFRWPNQFEQFLAHIDRMGNGKTDLVVDGDLFDLWQSVGTDCTADRGKDYGCTETESLERLQSVLRAHERELKALGRFATTAENRVIIIPGNHDAALLFPRVRDAALRLIGGGQRVAFASTGYWLSEDKLVYVEHGHQIGHEANKWEKWPTPFLERGGERYLQRPWGEQFVQDYYNRLENQFQVIDNISSEAQGVLYAIAAEGPGGTIADLAGFVKFSLFDVSWSQFKGGLGERKEGPSSEWDIATIRGQGPQFLADSLPVDHPLSPHVRNPKSAQEKEQLKQLFDQLSDSDIETICDERASLMAQQEGKQETTITNCPALNKGGLGAAVQAIVSLGSRDKVIGNHMEKVVCPSVPGCMEKPFAVFIFGHTHSVRSPRPLSLSNGYWQPKVVNSGAWQRVATPKQVKEISRQKGLSWGSVLPELVPEDLPPNYSFVVIRPYPQGGHPEPLLQCWSGEENQKGTTRDDCDFGQ
jgi:UDP-2,3-diacylglucosamine pyrophosphatase LpxH